MGRARVGCGREDREVVGPQCRALLRHDVGEPLVVAEGVEEVPRVAERDDDLARDQQVRVQVGVVRRGPLAGSLDHVRCGLELRLVGRVRAEAEPAQRGTHRLASVVEEQDPAGQLACDLGVEHEVPRRVDITEQLDVDTQTGRAPQERHGEQQPRVVGRVGEVLVDVRDVGDRRARQRQQEVVLTHDLDHVVRRDDGVVLRATCDDACEHLLVLGVEVLDDADAELGLEVGDDVGVHVVVPVVQQQVPVGLAGDAVGCGRARARVVAAGRGGQGQRGDGRGGSDARAHGAPPGGAVGVGVLRVVQVVGAPGIRRPGAIAGRRVAVRRRSVVPGGTATR